MLEFTSRGVDITCMRFLRLDFRDDLNSIDLHPLVTVVTSLDSDHQRQLLQAVRRLASGTAVGLRGLVQHEGLLVELDAGSADLLGTPPTSADVLVYLDNATDAAGLVALRAEIDQWERQAEFDAVVVEEIRANLDLAAKASAARLRRQIDPENDDSSTTNAADLRLGAVRSAYDRLLATDRTFTDADPDLVAVVERWDDYVRRADDNEEHLSKLARRVSVAEADLSMRRKEMMKADEEAQPVVLTADEEARLEILADPSTDPTRKGRRKNSLSEEEEEEMRALLAKVGAESWTAFSVQRLSPAVAPEKKSALERATKAMSEAEQTLINARDERDADETASLLNDELEEIKNDARPYLGVLVPTDIGSALRDQIQIVDNPEWSDALRALRDTLAANDVRPTGGIEPDEIIEWTKSWISQESEPHDRRAGDTKAISDPVAALAERTRALAQHDRAVARLDAAEQRAADSAKRLADLRKSQETWSERPPITNAAEVMERVNPVVEQSIADAGGAVPIVLIGDFNDVPDAETVTLMAELESLGSQLQVIVVTQRAEVARWAMDAGLERAGICRGVKALI